ncbi:MAG TPA: hypothetical protein VEI02_16960, partial [Planctomycetota bacterium]|nr:hypothetical protein [Planctomycetota bacterium]
RIETLYYACGGYVCHGNAKCRRALIAKDEFERLVTAATREHLESFSVGAGAGLLLEALAAESPDAEAVAKREADLRRRAADERKRLDGMVACLTPELAPVLGEKILEAKRKAEALAAEADAAARERTAAKDAAALSAALIRDAAAIGAAMEHATFHETREILRNLVVEVMIDPGRKEGEIVFHAAPLTATAAAGMDPAELDARVARTIAARTDAAAVEAGTAPDGAKEAAAHAAGEAITPEMNKDATVGDDHVLSLVMAGAGVARLKRAVVLFNSGRRARWAA